MTTIDILFKKVFKNKILFNLIYGYVHCKESVLDWTIKSLLERKEFKKFEEIINCNLYSKITQDNWYFELKPNESDIIPLLNYRGLKSSTLILFYCKFKHLFLKNKLKNKIISESLKGGNLEIVTFLLQQGFQYKFSKFNDYASMKFHSGLFEQLLDCGNSLDCYNFVLSILPNLITPKLFNKERMILWLIKYFSGKKYYNIYPIIIPLINTTVSLAYAIKISFQNLDLKLSNQIIIQNNKLNLITKSSIIILVVKDSNFIMNNKYFKIFSNYLSNTTTNTTATDNHYNINLFERVIKSSHFEGKVIYSLKVWDVNEDLLVLLRGCYVPNSLEEFKFMLKKVPNFKICFSARVELIVLARHISSEILDLEYSKFFINEYFHNSATIDNIEYTNQDYSICVRIFCDSIPEISCYFLKEKISKRMIPLISSGVLYVRGFSCSNFGNLKILKYAEKNYSVKPTIDTLHMAVTNGYTEIIKYLCETLTPISLFPPPLRVPQLQQVLMMLMTCEKNNDFQSFTSILQSKSITFFRFVESKSVFEYKILENKEIFKSKFLNHLFKEKLIDSKAIFKRYCKFDLNLFLLFKYNKNWVNQEYFFQLIQDSKIQVFNNIILDQLFLSTFLKTDKLKDKFIITLISTCPRRLLYFILNSNYLLEIGFNRIFKYLILFSNSPSITINQLLSITTTTTSTNNNFYNSLLLNLILFYDKNLNLIKEIKFSNQSNNNYNFQNFKDFLNQTLSEKSQKKFKDNYFKILNSSNILNQIGFNY
ncbi:hypothetical protein ACTFIR_008102 [Dictyostelium discoideum]